MGAETVPNHADYRLMGRASLEALSEYNEVNLFLRGIVPTLGLKQGRYITNGAFVRLENRNTH